MFMQKMYTEILFTDWTFSSQELQLSLLYAPSTEQKGPNSKFAATHRDIKMQGQMPLTLYNSYLYMYPFPNQNRYI